MKKIAAASRVNVSADGHGVVFGAKASRLLDNKIHIESTRVKSGEPNPAPKLATLIASVRAGADYVDESQPLSPQLV